MFSLPVPTQVTYTPFGDMVLLKCVKPCDPAMGVYRSVVTCKERVLCVAPPRAIPIEEFMAKYPIETVRVDEFVDGTMVNVFYRDTWQLCTRSNIGATNTFLEGAPPFKELFMDAANVMGLNLNTLDKTLCYSFVLQHPKNRIVTPVKNPALVLIKCYSISGQEVTEREWDFPKPNPRVLQPASYEDVKEMAKMVPYALKGYMFHAPDGTRAKMMGEEYLQVSALRGSEPSVKHRVLQLRDDDRLRSFLYYFAEYRDLAVLMRTSVRIFVNDLYSEYLTCYKEKAKTMNECRREFRPHLYALHQQYVATWPTPMHKKRVVEYVAKLSATQLCEIV